MSTSRNVSEVVLIPKSSQSTIYLLYVRCILKDNGYSRQFKKDSQQDYFTGLKRLCTEIGILIYMYSLYAMKLLCQ